MKKLIVVVVTIVVLVILLAPVKWFKPAPTSTHVDPHPVSQKVPYRANPWTDKLGE